MTQRLYLHIGLLKTATTFLQDGLWAHKQALGERGLLVPGRHRRRHLLASLDLRQDPKLARRAGDVAHPWQDLVDEVLAWSGPTAVISHEFFAPASEEQVRRALAKVPGVEVHVVVTARVLTQLAPSLWQEWVKNGGRAAIDDFLVRGEFDPHDEWGWAAYDLADVLQRWSTVVPSDRIHVLPMRADHSRRSEIWRRFLTTIGVDDAGLEPPEEVANVSVGLVQVETLRGINAELVDFASAGDRSNWIRTHLAHGMLPQTRERFRPGDEQWALLVERARLALAMVSHEGFDLRGDLSALVPPERAPEVRHPEEVTPAEKLDTASRTIAAMLTDVRIRSRHNKALERDLEVVKRRHARVGFATQLLRRGKVQS